MSKAGGRKNYYRVSIGGKETFTKEGEVSSEKGLTHMEIKKNSHDDIVNIIRRIKDEYSRKKQL